MKGPELYSGLRIGSLTLLNETSGGRWHCACDCGCHTNPYAANLIAGRTRSCGSCGKNTYRNLSDDKTVEVTSTNGIKFYIDRADELLARRHKWSVTRSKAGSLTVISANRVCLHRLILGSPEGMEIDHIDLDRLNNRRSNLRICTHQQNQLNQPLQSNNTSGYAGVMYVKRKGRFSARIKFFQKEIHLGYYSSKIEAAQARNEAIKFLFKEFGILNDVPEAPYWIKAIVYEKCFSKIQVRASAANSMKEAC